MRDSKVMLQDMTAAGMLVKPMDTGYVAAYELGIAMQCSFYAQVRGEDTREGYVAHMATELADCITQLRIWAQLHNLDWDTLVGMGEDKLYERINEMLTRIRPRPTDEIDRSPGGGVITPTPRKPYTYSREGD